MAFDVSHDSVRPELDMAFRASAGREVYSYVYKDAVVAVICVAYCYGVPTTVVDLEQNYAVPSEADDDDRIVAVPYTVWSLRHGFGRSVVMAAIDHIKAIYPNVSRVVTLSPRTEMAKRFHLANGAKHISENEESSNFEYALVGR